MAIPDKDKFPTDGETMNALHEGLGAVLLAVVESMPLGQRLTVAAKLADLAKNAESAGMATLETLLLDLHLVAQP